MENISISVQQYLKYRNSKPQLSVGTEKSDKKPQLLQSQKSEALIKHYNMRLKQALELFYEQVGDDDAKNEELYEDFNQAWKKVAHAVNSTQKHTTIDAFAFQKKIEEYKQIALQEAIKQQENGNSNYETDSQN